MYSSNAIYNLMYIYINLWMHTVLPCITWCTYPVTWHAILLCDPLTLGWNTCFLPMADTMMEAAPIKLQWLCDWCMHGDKDATTLVLRSLLLLVLIHCVWFEHVSPKLHVSAQFTGFMIRHAWSKFMVTLQSYIARSPHADQVILCKQHDLDLLDLCMVALMLQLYTCKYSDTAQQKITHANSLQKLLVVLTTEWLPWLQTKLRRQCLFWY